MDLERPVSWLENKVKNEETLNETVKHSLN